MKYSRILTIAVACAMGAAASPAVPQTAAASFDERTAANGYARTVAAASTRSRAQLSNPDGSNYPCNYDQTASAASQRHMQRYQPPNPSETLASNTCITNFSGLQVPAQIGASSQVLGIVNQYMSSCQNSSNAYSSIVNGMISGDARTFLNKISTTTSQVQRLSNVVGRIADKTHQGGVSDAAKSVSGAAGTVGSTASNPTGQLPPVPGSQTITDRFLQLWR
jgi:hypothetical protein